MQGRWKILVVAALAFALAGAAVAAVAVNRQPHGLVTRAAAGAITKVAVAQSNDASTITSTSAWTNLPGAKVAIKVLPKQRALFLATFSASERCSGSGFAADECDLRIVVDGHEMSPGPVGPNNGGAFDSHPLTGDDYLEMHAIQRSKLVGPGLHTVQVQVQAGTTPFLLDSWLLSVLSSKVG
jgi:hypothetical protein